MVMPHSDDQPPPPPAHQLTRQPSIVKSVDAVYPAEAKADGLSGDVGLEITLAANGSITDLKVAEPGGHGFDEAAMAAVKQFVFTPAEIDGQPAAVTFHYVYHFVMPLPPPPPSTPDAGVEVHLSGVVRQRASKDPLPGITVSFDGVERATTGPGGVFDFTLVAERQYHQLSAYATGYQRLDKTVDLSQGKTLTLTLFLRPKIEGMFQTVVKAQADKDAVTVYTLDRLEIQRAPGTFGDPLHVITDLPGVARTPFDLGFLVVRGADPVDTQVYLDGVAIPLLYHFGGGPAVVNPEFIDSVDFYPGGQGPKYGNAIGGTVDATSRQLKPDRLHLSADVNAAFAQGFAQVPLGDDWVVAAAGRRSYFDLVLPAFLSSGTVVVPYFWDYQLKVDTGKPGDRNTFGLMLYGSNDTLKVLSPNFAGSQAGLDVNYNTQFHRLVGRWTYKDDRFTSVFKPSAGIEDRSFAFGTNNFRFTFYDVALRHDMSYELSSRQKLNFGEDITYEWFNAGVTLPTIQGYAVFPGSSVQEPPEDITRYFNGLELGLWVEDVIKLRSNFSIVPGVRLQAYDLQNNFLPSLEPRFSFRWFLTPRLLIKGSIGLYHEPPALQDFDQQFGNPNLQLLQAIQYSGGFEYPILYSLLPKLHLDVVGFYSDRSGLLNGFLGPAAPGQVSIANGGLGRAYGLEVYLHHDITQRLFGWISYTFSRAEQTFGPNQPWSLTTFDETHILSAVLSYNLGAGFFLGGRFRYVTGEPYTPIVSSTYNADTDTYTGLSGTIDSARLPSYLQLDLRLDKEFTFERWKLDLYLDCWNVTNNSNTELLVYDYRDRTTAKLPGYPILPLLGIRGEY